MRVPVTVRVLVSAVCCTTFLATIGAGTGGSAVGATADAGRRQQVVTSAPAAALGRWSVQPTGPHTYLLTWTSPRPLQVTDSRPEIAGPGAVSSSTVVDSTGRHVSVTVHATTLPDVGAYDVTAGARVLDKRSPVEQRSAKGVGRRPATTQLADDPGVPGPFHVVSADYRLPGVKLPGLPAKVEMLGHVVRPVQSDPADPLVLFLHGRHDSCYQTGQVPTGPQPDWPCGQGESPVPSYLGYVYAQRLLASQGYVTVSISADGINAQDYRAADGGAADRALLVRRHLALWAQWARSGRYAVDMSHVVLVGHSRGGEGVDRASITTPLSAPYTISGQVLIGPTDFGYQTAPYVPTVTILPYCDGDVSDLEGQQFTDIARDAAPDDTALHSSVLVMGADHNFFNSEWTPGISAAPSFDDWGGPEHKTCGSKTPARLTAAEQRAVGRTYIAGAVHLFAKGDDGVLPMFDGSVVSVASAGNADVRSEAVGGGRVLRRPGFGALPSPAPTATTLICRGTTGPVGSKACGAGIDPVRAPHWVEGFSPGLPTRPAFQMTWTSAGQTGGLVFRSPLDLSSASSLDLRTIVDPRIGDVSLALRLYDAQGETLATPVNAGDLPALPTGDYSLGKEWAQTLRVPLSAIPVDHRDAVTRIDLVARNARGRVWVLDVAAVPTALPAVPHRRLPVVDLGTAEKAEGDGPAASSIAVPYTVSGDLTSPGRLTVLASDTSTGESQPAMSVVIPAHATGGTIKVPYQPNRIDDIDVRTITVDAYATRGVMTGSYIGKGRIVDDDPTPSLVAAPVRPRVVEGAPARWRLTLSKPVDYYLFVRANPVRGHGTRARFTVGDLPKKLRQESFRPVPPLSTPLWTTNFTTYVSILPGHATGRLALPTSAPAKVDGDRTITMRFHTPGYTLAGPPAAATVVVRDQPH